jgi:hypothetical protein
MSKKKHKDYPQYKIRIYKSIKSSRSIFYNVEEYHKKDSKHYGEPTYYSIGGGSTILGTKFAIFYANRLIKRIEKKFPVKYYTIDGREIKRNGGKK